MSKFVSVLASEAKDSPVVTVTEAFAKSVGAKVLEDEPAVDHLDRPLQPRERGAYKNPPEPDFRPAIQLPEDFEEKKAATATQTPDTPPVSATTTTGGPAVSQPEEASK